MMLAAHEDVASQRLGFPVGLGGEDFTLLWNFRLLVDGVETRTDPGLEVIDAGEGPGERKHRRPVRLWLMTFEAGRERVVQVDYNIIWSAADVGLYTWSCEYVLTGGAWWKDPVTDLSVAVRLSSPLPLVSLRLRPGGFHYAADSLGWSFRDIRPEEDLDISWSPVLAGKFKGRFLEPFRHPGGDYFWNCEPVRLPESDFWNYFPDLADSLDDPATQGELEVARDRVEEARDVIEARGGRSFDDQGRRERFEAEPWYRPRRDYSREGLTAMERLNLDWCDAVSEALSASRTLEELAAALRTVEETYW
jgi:hypothetical protein